MTLNGRHIELEGATKIHKVKGAGGVMATLTLGRNIAGYGTAVNFTTPTASLFAYLVPSGLDTVGFLQPSYLNFDLTLLKIPSRRIEVPPLRPSPPRSPRSYRPPVAKAVREEVRKTCVQPPNKAIWFLPQQRF